MSNDATNRSEDRRLAATYRAVANERAPDHLNDRILQMAASRRTPYARAWVWMRPLATAATIGLCLALVLELTRIPQPDQDLIGIPTADEADSAKSPSKIDDRGATKAGTADTATASPREPGRDTAGNAPSAPAAGENDRFSKEEFKARDITSLRDAEDAARARADADQAAPRQHTDSNEPSLRQARPDDKSLHRPEAQAFPGHPVAASEIAGGAPDAPRDGAMSAAGKPLPEMFCAESLRQDPASWLVCIRELRENGRHQEARLEFEQFLQIFPNYEDLDGHK